MNAYPPAQLGDIADVVAGDPAPQDPQAFAPDGPLFVRMYDVGRHHRHPALSDSADRLSSDWLAQNRLRLFPKGSILIPKSGASVNLNHRAKLATDAYVVSHLAVVIPDRTRIEPDYLYWWSVAYDPRAQAQVTSLPSLKLSTLKAATIYLPPLDEQRRIVGILNRAAKIEQLRAQAADRLREFLPALFVKMFGDESRIASCFRCLPLKEVAAIGSGATKGRKIDSSVAIEVPYLRVANVQDGYLNLDEIKTIVIRQGEEEKYALAYGDLVMTEGGDPDKLGRAAIWKGELEYCAHQNHIFRVRPNNQFVMTDYLRGVVGSLYGKAYFLSVAKQTTGIASINKTQIGDFPVPVPPIELQAQYGAKIANFRKINLTIDSSVATAATLSVTLMSHLLRDGL
ncbi:MAG: restriction endonuclease subunit S [Rhodospirillaceae bacterium]|nr:restriction endonuclease subunit S [Rhodospirillaceae bacterium]MYK14510.1 restriction endonuclease subunit S [Rhodospirillaceae bacterium]